MPSEIKPKTQLSLTIHDRMKAKGFSVHQLASATNVVYETIRGVVVGDRPPGKLLVLEICRVLNLDQSAINEMLVVEQMKRKFGRVPVFAKNPELRQVEELWSLLLPEEKEHIIWLMGSFAEKNRRRDGPARSQRIAPRPVRTP